MAFIPENAQAVGLIGKMTDSGLIHLGSGKTGELFLIPSFPEYLLMVRTDRISIFDFVLPALVPKKGSVLTAMPVLWMLEIGAITRKERYGGQHISYFGSSIDDHLPPGLRGDADLQTRALIVQKTEAPDIECIVRAHLTGTGLESYLGTGTVCGHRLPPGLRDGDRLPEPIFTPTSRAASGHDEPVDFLSVRKTHGRIPEDLSLDLFREAYAYAEKRGLVLADAKFEISQGKLIDEFLTPDTMRIWRKSDWEKSQSKEPRKAPGGFDKEYVRGWGRTVETPFTDKDGQAVVGIHRLDPENPEHLGFVSGLTVPEEVLSGTSGLYLESLRLLFDTDLKTFWKENGRVIG